LIHFCTQIDEKLDKQDLTLVKISDHGAADAFGIEEIPCLVYFENGVPEIYGGTIIHCITQYLQHSF